MWLYRNLLLIVLLVSSLYAYSQQQDLLFHLNAQLLTGKTVLKVKRDFDDPYLWVLTKNNGVYRVNSLTLAVDDYTSVFAEYNSLQFIDIAGSGPDMVFVAANSATVIQYEKGIFRLIGSADGIPGIVNSIGITQNNPGFSTGYPSLMIGTAQGFRLYDIKAGKIGDQSDSGDSRVYEATYRTEMYKDSSLQTSGINSGDTIQYQPVVYKPANGSTDIGYLWEGGREFGRKINTAVPVYESIEGYNAVYTNFFWGGSRGMFRNFANYSYSSAFAPAEHYLDGINVNKITTIYGLVPFGSGWYFDTNFLIKQNLLIGTDEGFYFSSSVYTSQADALRPFSLFHFDELGNVRVNDICVNAASTTPPICEDGVWLACDNGLYLLKPDYAQFLKSQQFQAAMFEGQDPTVSDMKICLGSSVTAWVPPARYAGSTLQWYKDGLELPARSADSLVINSTGDYYAVLYDPCENVHLETNHLTVEVVLPPVFTFNYPDNLQYCEGTPVTLSVQGSEGYQYRWYKDGQLNGITTTSMKATENGVYQVEVSSCENSWVPSKKVQVSFIHLPVPNLIADKPSYCIGDNATLTLSVPADPAYMINWYKDGDLIGNNTGQVSLVTNAPGNYTVMLTASEPNTDGSQCHFSSQALDIAFDPLPTVNIRQIITTTLCDGQTVDLEVSYDTGKVRWSDGESSNRITVGTSGNYTATVTTPAGCANLASVNVQFFPNPVLSLANADICAVEHHAATITAPPGMVSYLWNGQPGGQTYVADHQQTLTLTVTDSNGCQATQQIQVTDVCPSVIIPNTFTPNGDGINDIWDIPGLQYDPTALVKVFSRNGQEIFESRGYAVPWDGTYQGQKVPGGTYYYIITAKNNSEKYSGYITVIY
jgi:gliding motility-associated-like protein